MALTTAGVLLTDLAYFIPITYTPRYYIDRQNLSYDEALTGSSAFAYQLLAILNAASCVGRYVAGDMADRFGRYNTMIVSLFFCTVSVLGFWYPISLHQTSIHTHYWWFLYYYLGSAVVQMLA